MKTRTPVHKVLQNFGFLAGGRTVGDAFTFLLFVVLSRAFGQEGVGQYSFAIGLTGFFAVIAQFGLYSFSIKELARRPDSFRVNFGRIFSLRLFLSLVVFTLLLLILPFLPFSRESKLILVLVGAYQMILNLVDGLTAAFVAREDTHLSAVIEIMLKATAALGVIVVVLAGGSLVMALGVLPAAAGVHLLLAYALVAQKYGWPKLVASMSLLTQLAREALPYAFSTFLVQVYSRMDVVFLGFFLGMAAVGAFNAAYRIVFFFMFISHFAATAIFPLASRLYITSRKEFEELYHRSLGSIILMGVPIAAGVWLIAPGLIDLIFGEQFGESASVLRLLTGALLLTFLGRTMEVFLMSSDRQTERTKSYWIVAWVSVLGSLVLIRTFGVKGAAVAALASETLLVLLFAMRLRPVVGWPRIGSRLAISGIGAISFCVLFTLLPPLSMILVIPASALMYLGTLVLFTETRRNEIRILVGLLKGESGIWRHRATKLHGGI